MKFCCHLLLLITSLCAGELFLLPAHAADRYHGRVVDEETGQPLVGAVVTVVWYTTAIVSMERTKSFLSAQEALTDRDGKFELLASPEIDWNPFTSVRKPPDIVIYKAEHAPLTPGSPAWKQVASFGNTAVALKTGLVIKLPKLKSKQELMRFVDLGVVGIGQVPHARIAHLVRQVNVQRVLAGLRPYPETN